jgi:tRNA-dihydrouridine synthase B
MFEECLIRGRRYAPARFCAPLAGYTHSAFRRLLAELGGCGAAWTEMLAARQILSEDFARSPYVRRRPEEVNLIFQLMVKAGDPLDRILDRLGTQGVTAVDLNLACDAFSIRNCEAGSALFENFDSLRRVATEARRHWPGQLTAKIRLGSRKPGWEARFTERVQFLETCGLDALTLHPRFFEDKFKRRSQIELIPWAASLTRLPLIANGDLGDATHVASLGASLQSASAIMLGRMAIVRPWIFATWDHPNSVDHAGIWRKMCQYITDDFAPPTALRRIGMFAKYYAANFQFGHSFRMAIGNARTMAEAHDRAEDFFSRSPALLATPSYAEI